MPGPVLSTSHTLTNLILQTLIIPILHAWELSKAQGGLNKLQWQDLNPGHLAPKPMLLTFPLIRDPDSEAISHPSSLTVHSCDSGPGRRYYPQFTDEETEALRE